MLLTSASNMLKKESIKCVCMSRVHFYARATQKESFASTTGTMTTEGAQTPPRRADTPDTLLFKILLVCYVVVFVVGTSFICIVPIYLSFYDEEQWCPFDNGNATIFTTNLTALQKFNMNPQFDRNPCYYARMPQFLFFSLEECEFCRRLLVSVLLGALLG